MTDGVVPRPKGSEGAVYGTTGNDTFLGYLADEVFVGKGGNVTYMFSSNFGNGPIKGLEASSSVAQSERDFSGTGAHVVHVGSDVVISVDVNNSLHNTLLAQLAANNFHFA